MHLEVALGHHAHASEECRGVAVKLERMWSLNLTLWLGLLEVVLDPKERQSRSLKITQK